MRSFFVNFCKIEIKQIIIILSLCKLIQVSIQPFTSPPIKKRRLSPPSNKSHVVMLILCWNVAGLSTTVNRINESYGDSSRKKKPSIVLSEYLPVMELMLSVCKNTRFPYLNSRHVLSQWDAPISRDMNRFGAVTVVSTKIKRG